jgi:hypothetical protein
MSSHCPCCCCKDKGISELAVLVGQVQREVRESSFSAVRMVVMGSMM